jgi:hypothetical protein
VRGQHCRASHRRWRSVQSARSTRWIDRVLAVRRERRCAMRMQTDSHSCMPRRLEGSSRGLPSPCVGATPVPPPLRLRLCFCVFVCFPAARGAAKADAAQVAFRRWPDDAPCRLVNGDLFPLSYSPWRADQPAVGWMRLEDPGGHQAVRHTIPSQAPSRLEPDIFKFVHATTLYFAGICFCI